MDPISSQQFTILMDLDYTILITWTPLKMR